MSEAPLTHRRSLASAGSARLIGASATCASPLVGALGSMRWIHWVGEYLFVPGPCNGGSFLQKVVDVRLPIWPDLAVGPEARR